MEIDKGLLEKYALGNCSDEEKHLVEQWLMSTDEEETILTERALTSMTTSIWASLKHNFPARRLPVQQNWFTGLPHIAAAACLLVGVIGVSLFVTTKSTGIEIAFSTNGLDREVKATSNEIDFYLKPNSSVKGTVSTLSQGSLDFSGSFKIVSTAQNDMEIDFRIKSSKSVSTKKVTIRGKQTYYVGILKQDHAPDEILVLTSQQLEDIPPRIKIVAFKDYSI